MTKKTCKVCKEEKEKKDFYGTSGLTCRECKREQSAEQKKATSGRIIELLENILEGQQAIDERLGQLEDDLAKVRRKLKKTSA